MTDSMKFGPEWLRNPGASSSSNTPSSTPAGPKLPLAEYRYGREEMLSLFDKNMKAPEILPNYKKLYVDKIQSPLALMPTTEDEAVVSPTARVWSLRSPVGFGSTSVRGNARGGAVEKGRGKTKPAVHTNPFPRPTPVHDEDLRIMMKGLERSWPERNGGNEVGAGDWNGSPSSSPRKEYNCHGRSNMENWRRNRIEDDAGDGWRGSSATNNDRTYKWSRSASWREEDTPTSSVGVSHDMSAVLLTRSISSSASTNFLRVGGISGNSGGGGNEYKNTQNNGQLSSKQGSNLNWDSYDLLPEWAMENPTDGGGSFDASGAFHSPNEDCEENKESESSKECLIRGSDEIKEKKIEPDNSGVAINNKQDETIKMTDSHKTKTSEIVEDKERKAEENAFKDDLKTQNLHIKSENNDIKLKEISKLNTINVSPTPQIIPTSADQKNDSQDCELQNIGNSEDNVNKLGSKAAEISDRMQEVDDMVEKLIMEDEILTSLNRNSSLLNGASVNNNSPPTTPLLQQPLVNPPLMPHTQQISDLEWFYQDPQGVIQGPFAAAEMVEWYRAGYFDENLYVRRVCDARFAALGELVKMCGNSMPFLSSHLIPPLVGDMQPVAPGVPHITQNNQPTPSQQTAINTVKPNANSMMSTTDLIYLQFMQKQFLLHQQNAILSKLAATEPWPLLSPEQQQQLLNQQMSQIVLPNNLTNLTAISNSLPVVNPSTYALQQILAASTNELGAVKTNQALHNNLSSFGSEYSGQPSLHSLMQNNIPTQSSLGQQSVPPHHHNSTSIDNNPIKSLLMQLQMQKNGIPTTAAITAPPNAHNLNIPSKWTPNYAPPTSWSNESVNNATMATMNKSVWDFIPITQSKPDMKTEQQIIEEQLQKQNEKLIRQSSDLMMMRERGELISDLKDEQQMQTQLQQHQIQQSQLHHQQQLQQQQLPQQQLPQTSSQLQLQSSSHQLQQQSQQILNKKNEKAKIGSEERLQKSQKTDDESNKKFVKLNKIDKKESKKPQFEEERKKDATEDRKRQKEEKKRLQMEEEKRKQQQQEEEKRKQILEEKKRLEEIDQHRRAKMLENSIPKPIKQSNYASSIAPWSNAGLVGISAPGPNFAEIQKAEMERRAEEQRLQQILEDKRKSQLMEIMIQKENALKWNSQPLKSLNVKSLAEIQAEEHKRQLANEQANAISATEQSRRKDTEMSIATNNSSFNSIWSSRPSQNIAWSGKSAWTTTSSAGFWEEPAKIATNVSKYQSTNSRTLTKSQTVSNMQSVKSNTSVTNSNNVVNNQTNNVVNSKPQANQINNNKTQSNSGKGKTGSGANSGGVQNSKVNTNSSNSASKKDDARNEFTNWCIKTLSVMNSSVDVPTFIGFLQDIESPYEVKDYIRIYLGETKECTEFAKQFLERRSKYKNQQRAQNAHIDDMCSPAPAINPSSNDFQEVKGKGKKVKKNKMTKLDTRILGFSVTAAQDRLNVGDRDYADAP